MIDFIDVSLQFGGKYLFKDVNFKINGGDRIALVGANGTGKSSLLKMISGTLPPESGLLNKQKRISIGYLPQENIVHKGKTVFKEAESSLTGIVILKEKENEITHQLSAEGISEEERNDLINQLGEVHHKLEDLDSFTASSKIEKILTGLGFYENDFNRLTDELSGGWQMRIALAKILISQNDVLLLDEPTNHLDLDSLQWLIDFLKAYKGSLIIVSHDKHFVSSLTDRTLEIFNRKCSFYKGNYNDYLSFKEERDKLLVHQYQLQQDKIKETERFIERFRYKATKARQVQSRIKQLEKIEHVELPDSQQAINIKFPEVPQSGRIAIELKNISKSYGENEVFNQLDFTIERGEKIAFVGPNGAGKTTLAKIIAGLTSINSGERIIGYNTFIAYYAQDVADALDGELDIIETLMQETEEKTIGQLRSLLGNFLFTGDDVFKKVGILSGGEKSRVALAKILLTKANLVILDEPTNHLDYSSKLILQKALIDFKGSLVIVSHDVDFLRPIVSKVVEIKKGSTKYYSGGIDYYLDKKAEESDNLFNTEECIKTESSGLTKKEQKRIEAELRQKRYKSTKDIKREIELIETKIAKLEERLKILEEELADVKIYSNPSLVKLRHIEYSNVKDELKISVEKWTGLSEKLDEIERQFKDFETTGM
jgi:ATP-binding cassette subfamily F protein 3